jgi:hypothetical protein
MNTCFFFFLGDSALSSEAENIGESTVRSDLGLGLGLRLESGVGLALDLALGLVLGLGLDLDLELGLVFGASCSELDSSSELEGESTSA